MNIKREEYIMGDYSIGSKPTTGRSDQKQMERMKLYLEQQKARLASGLPKIDTARVGNTEIPEEYRAEANKQMATILESLNGMDIEEDSATTLTPLDEGENS